MSNLRNFLGIPFEEIIEVIQTRRRLMIRLINYEMMAQNKLIIWVKIYKVFSFFAGRTPCTVPLGNNPSLFINIH